ncbi:ATP-binding protein [Caldivirga sp. MU80]|uniref:ATP-binding protein n=1 Tax=Caldivirga sp. MU80 TaxID=1650354 RepID=UPI00082AAFE3|nr:ATP-binding protein [Caldivirga sp. MU80]
MGIGVDVGASARGVLKAVVERGLGEPIGRVSAGDVIIVGSEGAKVLVDVPFNDYVRHGVGVNDYLGIATIIHGRLVLGRVVEVRRSHVMGLVGASPILEPTEDYTGLATPATILLEPLTECPLEGFEDCEPNTVHTPIDPLSIVFKPSPTFLRRMLQLPGEGVLIGELYSGGRVVEGVDVKLPTHALYEHVLVIGTTGSGKTVLLKNMALSMLNNVKGSTVLALDLQGDYPHLALPNPVNAKPLFKPVGSLTVIQPITRDYLEGYRGLIEGVFGVEYLEDYLGEGGAELSDVKDAETLAKALGYALLRLFIRDVYGDAEVEGFNASVGGGGSEAVLHWVEATIKVGGSSFRLRLVPWSLRFSDVYIELPRIFPVFSERVGVILPRVLENAMNYINHGVNCAQQLSQRGSRCPGERPQAKVQARAGGEGTVEQGVVDLDALLREQACVELAAECLRLAWQQRDNIVRGLHMLGRLGVMDVKFTVGGKSVLLEEPNYGELLNGGLIVLDLRLFREQPTAASIIVYRVLSRVFEVRDVELRGGGEPRPTFILIDEAHNYFPQPERGVEDFNKDVVEAMINKLTRLGRVRRIGVVFATHTPDDLNNLILQLTNTKIALRSEGHVLERVGLREYSSEVTYAQDGVAVVKSYVFRTHSVTARAIPPQTMHRSHK